jgi:hypothetical protein
VEGLCQLLAARQKSGSLTDRKIAALNLWQTAAGGSNDMAVLLRQDSFDRLLQSIKQPGEGGRCRAASTCVEYMRAVLHVLEVEKVKQLLSEQQLRQMQQRASAEKQQFAQAAAPSNVAAAAKKAAPAATCRAAGIPVAPATPPGAAASGCDGWAGKSKTSATSGSGGGPFKPGFVQAGASSAWFMHQHACINHCCYVQSCTSTYESSCTVMRQWVGHRVPHQC